MILVDTSVWVAHLKQAQGHSGLIAALEQGLVSTHPFVEGELLLGGAPVDELLGGVSFLAIAPHREVRAFVRARGHPVRGLGWVDVHLTYSALINGQELMSLDRRLVRFLDLCRGAVGDL